MTASDPSVSETDRQCRSSVSLMQEYMRRYGMQTPGISREPHADLGMIVVIPCCNEPDIERALEALTTCHRPRCAVEIILVINDAVHAPGQVRDCNTATWQRAMTWAHRNDEPRFRLHVMDRRGQVSNHAGVGLARKAGMDEAAWRLALVNRLESGVIAGFDADCTCAANYLVEIERLFGERREAPGCSIYFEHPLDGGHGDDVRRAVALYELHLRCYVQGLRYAGYPFAFHTVGSSMAVRARTYIAQGGMNKRKAGEDFYFLHKIIPLGGYADLTSTQVSPSPRPSDRVPFGTGRAVGDQLAGKKLRSYPLQAFADLRAGLARVGELKPDDAEMGRALEGWPEALRTYLTEAGFLKALKDAGNNTQSAAAFRKRVLRWFDGFRVMKFVHHARNRYYGDSDVIEMGDELLQLRTGEKGGRHGAIGSEELLRAFRQLDRREWRPR